MNQARTQHRGPMPPWEGLKLAAAFANRRDRPWTLGYESVETPVLSSQARWEGRFPAEMTGSFFRNGPARHERGGQRYAHRWDGDGMVQRFALSPDGVSHVGRYVQTRKLTDEDAAGHMLYSGFGTPVDSVKPTPERIEQSNPANISIVLFNGDCLALWEAGQPYRLDPSSLATIGRVSWLDANRPMPFSAHPKIGPDGLLWNFGVDPLSDRLYVYSVAPDGTAASSRELQIEHIAPIHDFAVTNRYLVFLLPSITCNQDWLMAGASFAESCQWSPELGMRVMVIGKADQTQREFRLPAGCLFHVANAWDEGERIFVDYLRSPEPSSLLAGWSVMAGEYRHVRGAALTRATIDLQSGSARQEPLLDHDAEFPSVLPADLARPHQRLLCLERSSSRAREVPGFDRVALIDAATAARQSFSYGDDWLVEEHVLIAGADPRTPRWVLGTALDLHSRKTAVSLFDVEDVSRGPVARAYLPYSLPLGLHGTFVPDQAA